MYLGFDIGGSSIKAVAVKNRKVISSRINERFHQNLSGLLSSIEEMKEEFVLENRREKIKGIGFSIANPLDKKRERLVSEHKFPKLQNRNLKKLLEKNLAPYPVLLEHDSHAFLLCEKKIGIAKNLQNAYFLALGSSVGDALMINGQIIRGFHGSAGQIVDTVMELSKKTKLRKLFGSRYIKSTLKMSTVDAVKKAKAGNKNITKTLETMGYNLGAAVANVVNTIDPGVIIIGGGQLPAKKFFFPGIKRAIKEFVISKDAQKTKILWSKLGRFGGALGAALLFEK